MTSSPLVTVLVPIFNGEKYLRPALESIISQTFKSFEVLLINDGSTDNSINIMNEFASLDQRVRIIDKRNTGLTDTLNCGVAESMGAWISRMDQDDIASTKRLDLQVRKVNSDQSLILVGSNFETLDELTHKTKIYRIPNHHDHLVRRLHRLQGFFPHSSAMFHTESARRIGGYDQQALYNEDWDLWLRLSECGKIGSLPECLVTIRKHPLQMTENSGVIDPQGEAFVSSTLQLLRIRSQIFHSQPNLDREDLRVWIQGTKRYKKYREIILLQQSIRSMTSLERYIKLVLRISTQPLSALRLILYWLNGTSGPKLTASKISKELSRSSAVINKVTYTE